MSIEDQKDTEATDEEKQIELLEDQPLPQFSLLTLLHHKHILTINDPEITQNEKKVAHEQLMKKIKEDNMAPYYKYISDALPKIFSFDNFTYEQMSKENSTKITELEKAIAEAEQGLGEIEVRDATWTLAQYYMSIGDKANAVKYCEMTFEQTQGSASKIDVVFALVRLGFAFQDMELAETQVKRVKTIVENGGDWERKNLLMVYEATLLLTQRQFAQSAQLLIKSISTFTATELYPYTQFVFYTVLVSLCTVPRTELNKSILLQSEILSVIDQIPHLRQYASSLYNCDYAEFFSSLSEIITAIKHDPFLSPHLTHYVREIRVHTYSQYLQPFRQATIASMAKTFGISEEMCEAELYKFISTSRLAAKLDGINRVIITQRVDVKGQQYEDLIKSGDALLNRIQKLTKLISY